MVIGFPMFPGFDSWHDQASRFGGGKISSMTLLTSFVLNIGFALAKQMVSGLVGDNAWKGLSDGVQIIFTSWLGRS